MNDELVKSQDQRICHFDRREKSYIYKMLRRKDFSFYSKRQLEETFYEAVNELLPFK